MKRFLLHEPPAIRVDRSAGAACYGFILDELEPQVGTGAYAVVETARDLDAWIERMDGETVGEREIRRRLCTAPTEFAREVPALGDVLPQLLDLLRRPEPGEREAREIARLALLVSAWAESLGAVRSAIAFAQLAQEADAEASPADPHFACELGRVAADAPGHEVLGAAWLTWAALHARQLGRWDVAVRALHALVERAVRRGEAAPAARLCRLAGIAERRQQQAAQPARAAAPTRVPHTK